MSAYVLSNHNRQTQVPMTDRSNNTRQSPLEKAEALWIPFGLWALSVVFVAVYSFYIYEVLIASDPSLKHLLLPASSTNLLLSVLSQAFAQLIETLVSVVLNALRWQFASSGSSLGTFFGLSSATNWMSILMLTVASGFRNLWGLFR